MVHELDSFMEAQSNALQKLEVSALTLTLTLVSLCLLSLDRRIKNSAPFLDGE